MKETPHKMARRTGRRPGNPDTREAILTAAREAFAERGYDSASIRAIATSAGVDPALVHHYFGNKEQLFMATVNLPVEPRQLLPQVLDGSREQVGERLARTFLTTWDSPVGVAGAAIFRSAMSNEWTLRLLREFVLRHILRPIVASLDIDPAEAPLRTSLVATQISGLALMRYIIKMEPLASAPRETVVAAVGPNLQRYLLGELAGVFPPAS